MNDLRSDVDERQADERAHLYLPSSVKTVMSQEALQAVSLYQSRLIRRSIRAASIMAGRMSQHETGIISTAAHFLISPTLTVLPPRQYCLQSFPSVSEE